MLLLALLLTLVPLATAQNQYCSFTPGHTLCNNQGLGPRCGGTVPARGVSKQDAAVIVAQHNKLRDLVARGQEARGRPGPQPAAANMRLMEYDAELATVAQGHADQCIFDHECGECRRVSRFSVGQNLFISFQSFFDPTVQWERAIQAWYDEVALFHPAMISPFRFSEDLGHYTQMVWWSTWKIGCGFTMYKEGRWWKKLYTCDYGPGGNIIFGSMYRVGNPCSLCPAGTRCSLQYPGLCEVPGDDGDESTGIDVTVAPASTSSTIVPTSSTTSAITTTSTIATTTPNTILDANNFNNDIPIIPSGDGDSNDLDGEGDRTAPSGEGNSSPSGEGDSSDPTGDGDSSDPSGDSESRTPGASGSVAPDDSGSRDPLRPQNGSSNRIPLLTLSGDGSILPVLPGRGKGDEVLDFNLLIEFFNSVRRRTRTRQGSADDLATALSHSGPKSIIRTIFSSGNFTISNPSASTNPTSAPNSAETTTLFTELIARSTESVTPSTEPQTRPTGSTTHFTESLTRPTEPTTRPTESTTRPTESINPITEPKFRPTEPTTRPTELRTRLADPQTRPTEPTTRLTEPQTRTTEPTTRLTEPTTRPMEPTTRLSEPQTRPTEPTNRLTEPQSRPTEPQFRPTEPTTRFTEPLSRPTETLPNNIYSTARSAERITHSTETFPPTPSLLIIEMTNTTTSTTETPTPPTVIDNSSFTPEEPNRGQTFNNNDNNNNLFRAVRPQRPSPEFVTTEAPKHNFVPFSGTKPHTSDLLPFLNRNGLATKIITTNTLSSVHSILNSLPPGARPIVLFRTGPGQVTELDPRTLSPVPRHRRSASINEPRVPGFSLLLACDFSTRPCSFNQIGANWTLASSGTRGQYAEVLLSSGQQTQLLLQEDVPSPKSKVLCIYLTYRRTFATSVANVTADHLPTVKVGAWGPKTPLLQTVPGSEENVWEVSRVRLEPVKGDFVLLLQVEAADAPSRVAFGELTVEDGSC